ncbi:hypothetical protein HK405_014151, partial [Cladochytrium tenue]
YPEAPAHLRGGLRVLDVRLTDELDPFFLQQLSIGEDDFHSLRVEQNLLVDFQQFPLKFVELLEECERCGSEDHPKFVAQMTLGSGPNPSMLSIVETNTFKHIIHLSLYFVAGSDATVKSYLASIVKELKVQNSTLQAQLQNTSETLADKVKESSASVTGLTAELERIKIANVEHSGQIQLSFNQRLNEEKDRYQKEKDDLRANFENEKRVMQQKYEDQIKQLSQQHSSLQSSQNQILGRTQNVESTLASEKKKNEQLATELRDFQRECELLRGEKRDLEALKSTLERELGESRDARASFEARCQELESTVRQLEFSLRESADQATRLEETLDSFRSQNIKLDENFRKASDEIGKGNEIIRRLQADLKAAKSKIKLKNVVTLQQEKLLDERAGSIDGLQKDLTELKELTARKEAECESLKKKVDELGEKVEESKKIIEDNTHVIEWLHKQLNEDAVNRPFLPSKSASALPAFSRFESDRFGADRFAGASAALSSVGREFN